MIDNDGGLPSEDCLNTDDITFTVFGVEAAPLLAPPSHKDISSECKLSSVTRHLRCCALPPSQLRQSSLPLLLLLLLAWQRDPAANISVLWRRRQRREHSGIESSFRFQKHVKTDEPWQKQYFSCTNQKLLLTMKIGQMAGSVTISFMSLSS